MTTGGSSGLDWQLGVDRLVQELWTWSPGRWTPSHVQAARGLAEELARLAAEAGAGPPCPVELPVLEPYGLADQVAVLAHEVALAPAANLVLDRALVSLASARSALGLS